MTVNSSDYCFPILVATRQHVFRETIKITTDASRPSFLLLAMRRWFRLSRC